MREWKHSASKESRRLRVEARRERRRQQQARQREAEARESAYRAALARPPDSPAQAVERLLVDEPERGRAQTLRELLAPVAERAPRLIRADTLAALKLDRGPRRRRGQPLPGREGRADAGSLTRTM